MLEIQSVTYYWEEFFKTHPDNTEFRSLVSEDPVLIKIFNFSSVPWIWKDLKNYPFDAKQEELKTISKEDKEHLAQRCFQADAKYVEWFNCLSNLFDVVFSTLILKGFLDIEAKKEGIIDEEILKLVESKFHKFISRDEIIILKEVDGIQKVIRQYGRYYPIRWINVVETHNKKQRVIETVCQEHFILPPTKEEIERPFSGWDRFSVINLNKYGKEVRDISFGNLLLDRTGSEKYTVKHVVESYYRGTPLFAKPFIYPIQERYRPLGKKKVGSFIQKYGTKLGTKEELLTTFDEKLYEKALMYDPLSPVDPAGYFQATLKYFENEIFEDLSTTAFDVPCDNHCKREKELMNKLPNKPPCEFEDKRGYCTDPKRRRALRSAIESSGGKLSDPIIDKQGTKSKGKLKLEDVVSKDQYALKETIKEEELKEGALLVKIYRDFPELENIIAKEEEEIALSDRERQIKSRSLKKIEKIKEKYLKD